jgi:membrane protease YdiL (CAAX protease family)
MSMEQVSRGQVVGWALATEGALAALALALGWLLSIPVLGDLPWEPLALVWGVIATLPLLLGFAVCVRWPHGPLAPIKQFADRVVKPLFTPCTFYDLAFIALLAGFGEELLFRGVLQAWFVNHLGFWPGVLLASLLFGLVHPITPTYAVLAGLVGLYLGILVYLEGNVLAACVTHALYDLVALIYLVRFNGKSLENSA